MQPGLKVPVFMKNILIVFFQIVFIQVEYLAMPSIGQVTAFVTKCLSLTHSFSVIISASFAINHILPKTRLLGLHNCVADNMSLALNQFDADQKLAFKI